MNMFVLWVLILCILGGYSSGFRKFLKKVEEQFEDKIKPPKLFEGNWDIKLKKFSPREIVESMNGSSLKLENMGSISFNEFILMDEISLELDFGNLMLTSLFGDSLTLPKLEIDLQFHIHKGIFSTTIDVNLKARDIAISMGVLKNQECDVSQTIEVNLSGMNSAEKFIVSQINVEEKARKLIESNVKKTVCEFIGNTIGKLMNSNEL